ncbi:ATP-binding protein [Actinosynnema sp. CS-041913]|uniref:ATP-binding protein n=1 Tax=Actinosynnema sp. CS-041913 TaxID=3239917 RepID=UPI003D90882A
MTTRLRVALVAALVSATLLTIGAVYLVRQMDNQLQAGADDLATAGSLRVAELIDQVGDPRRLPTMLGIGPYEIVDLAGERVVTCPELGPERAGRPFLAPTGSAGSMFGLGAPRTVVVDVVIGTDDKCLFSADFSPPGPARVASILSGDGRYVVHLAAKPVPEAERLVAAVRVVLWIAVPLTVLLIGLVAWFAVGRALQPVAAIRREVAEISAHDLDRRVPVPRARDEIADLAGTMNDMLARLATSLARQRQFTSDASHELRTPLASVRTQLEVLLAHPDRVDWRRTASDVVLDLERMQAVVADLMLLTRVEGAPPVDESVDLAALVGVPGSVVVQGSALHLQRLVRNLLDNAEHHKESQVGTTLTTEDGYAVLTVADDGPGIPEADRERVFERFVRLDEGRARDEGGAGLGLAIAREIAHAHGGTVEVAPSTRGAKLVVRLPLG